MIPARLAAAAAASGGGALPRLHQAAARAPLTPRWTAARLFAAPSTSVRGNTYLGGGLTSPGISFSMTASPSDPSTGWNIAGQGDFLFAGQFGYSFPDKSWFWELGIGWPPGVGVMGFYVFDPWWAPKPKIKPMQCH